MRLSNVDTEKLKRFKCKLTCCFKLVPDIVRDGIREFMNDTDGPAGKGERELMGLSVDGYL